MNTPSKNHIGRKISRLRELRDMKQEALAQANGNKSASNFYNGKQRNY